MGLKGLPIDKNAFICYKTIIGRQRALETGLNPTSLG